MKTRHKIMSFLLSGAMVFSLLPASAIGTVKAASVNYALTATATASGSETSAFGPEKAKDGDATTKTSRWASEERDASESTPHWKKSRSSIWIIRCRPDISVSASIRLTQPQKALPGKQFLSMNLKFMGKNRAAAVKSGML